MKIVLTGFDGYIGSVLAPYLIRKGHEVTGLDTGFYNNGWLYRDRSQPLIPESIHKDIREIEKKDLEGFDAVVHLAELSNDPLGQLKPDITQKINYKATLRLARLSKVCRIRRFIYTSSCSVYGTNGDDFKTEESELNPQSIYAECKILVEREVSKMADDQFSPVFLRNATAYGLSPKMRFDIVLNNLCGHAWHNKRIEMISNGTPWRPLVHVLDICKAIKLSLEGPVEDIHNQILNVGDTNENYQIRDVADITASVFNNCDIKTGTENNDPRSYRVSFEKIKRVLPGFTCDYDVTKGVMQLFNLFKNINLSKEDFNSRSFIRLKQIQHLIETRQVDEQLFWTENFKADKPFQSKFVIPNNCQVDIS